MSADYGKKGFKELLKESNQLIVRTRWTYLEKLFCSRCQKSHDKDGDLRCDTMGRLLCECGTQLRRSPRKKKAREKLKSPVYI